MEEAACVVHERERPGGGKDKRLVLFVAGPADPPPADRRAEGIMQLTTWLRSLCILGGSRSLTTYQDVSRPRKIAQKSTTLHWRNPGYNPCVVQTVSPRDHFSQAFAETQGCAARYGRGTPTSTRGSDRAPAGRAASGLGAFCALDCEIVGILRCPRDVAPYDGRRDALQTHCDSH